MIVSRILLYTSIFLIHFSCVSTQETETHIVDKKLEKNLELPKIEKDLKTANNYAKDGLLKESVNEYNQILKNQPNHHVARRNKAMVLVKIGDYKQAASQFKQVIERFSNDFDSNFYYAEALRGNRKFADAIYWYKNALRLKKNEPKTLKALAWSYYSIKFYSEALKTARVLYTVDSKDPQSIIIIARTFIKLDRHNDAYKILRKAKRVLNKKDPMYANILSIEGDIYMENGQTQKGMAFYKDAVKLDPLLTSALMGLGKGFILEGSYKDAIEHIERAIRIQPRMYSNFYYLGQAYEKVDPKKSIRFYQVFKRRAATDPEYLSLMKDVKQRVSALQGK